MKTAFLIGGATAVLVLAAGAAVAQQAAPRAMAEPVSRADFVDRRVERLTAIDANRDGAVSAQEMTAAKSARRAERAASAFDRLDADRNGQLSREEFSARAERAPRAARAGRGSDAGPRAARRAERVAARGPVNIAEARTRAEQAFARLDADSDGVVTVEERRAQRAEHRAARRAAGATRAPASE